MDISGLLESNWRGVVYAGGGSLFISDLSTTPGASSTLLEATVPYSQQATIELLGYEPESHCSERTTRDLAMQAYQRARQLAPPDEQPHTFGLAITAALRSNRPKRGDHRAYVALQTPMSTAAWHVEFEKGALTRLEEERKLADLTMGFLLYGLELDESNADYKPTNWAGFDDSIVPLLTEEPAVCGRYENAVLPGAFNPMHAGHRHMRNYAMERLGQNVAYELCIRNVDKPPLDCIDITERIRQITSHDCILTNQPTFLEKAELLFKDEGGVFVVGADTAVRIGEARYYGSESARDAAISRLSELGIRFLVFGRYDGTRFVSLDNLELPSSLRALCDGVSEEDFREDVSSTAIREAGSI